VTQAGRYIRVVIPADWPEAVTYAAGARLAREERDELIELARLGTDVGRYLGDREAAACAALGIDAWRRWLSLGWDRETERMVGA
jgi:hypothetical protein